MRLRRLRGRLDLKGPRPNRYTLTNRVDQGTQEIQGPFAERHPEVSGTILASHGGIYRDLPRVAVTILLVRSTGDSFVEKEPAQIRGGLPTSGGQDKLRNMKLSPVVVLVTLALSLAAWTFFYIKTPTMPLNSQETVLVVGVCFASVLLVKSAWDRVVKPRSGK
jgi:hypothetical protein